jgi:HNH endonuclease
MRRGSFCPMDLTYEYVNECLDYNVLTGVLTWKARPLHHFKREADQRTFNNARAGKEAGCPDGQGYRFVRIRTVLVNTHRVAWLLATGSWPENHIDHINGVRNDNRLVNLREATRSQNLSNCKLSKSNTTGVKGVSFRKGVRGGTYYVRFYVGGKMRHLGTHSTLEEAAKAVRDLRNRYHGKFANHG